MIRHFGMGFTRQLHYKTLYTLVESFLLGVPLHDFPNDLLQFGIVLVLALFLNALLPLLADDVSDPLEALCQLRFISDFLICRKNKA